MCVSVWNGGVAAHQFAQTDSSASTQMATPGEVYSIQLPAGTSLFSAPLDTGAGLAGPDFFGIPYESPLFFGWSAARQKFTTWDETMSKVGGGYWYYTPTPTNVTVMGKRLGGWRELSFKVFPGWHLFGVPFTEGIDWKSFRIYGAGNPVGLERAEELGWIRTPVYSQFGDEWREHEPGQKFEPGHAYWLYAKVPLSVRAERVAPAPLEGGVASEDPANTMGWTKEANEAVVSLFEAGHFIKETKGSPIGWIGGGFMALGGAFGLAHYGMETTNDQIYEQLEEMDKKLDTLLVEVEEVQNELTAIKDELTYMEKAYAATANLLTPLNNAQGYLDIYYSDPSSVSSRMFAQWKMSGCKPGVDRECLNEITQSSLDAFEASYYKVKDPSQVRNSSDDFLLWWSYSVNAQSGSITPFVGKTGGTADQLIRDIRDGILGTSQQTETGLLSYALARFYDSTYGCGGDAVDCDFIGKVYIPTEQMFQRAVIYQTELAEALVESYGVLASFNPTYADYAETTMGSLQDYLRGEAEAFVRVTEQIALIQASTGMYYYASFPRSEAAGILARGDYVAAQLIGNLYGIPGAKYDAPWPQSGIMGRVIYAAGEAGAQPGATPSTYTLCSKSCINMSTVSTNAYAVTSPLPYLLWTLSGDTMVGATNTQWFIRRLVPYQDPVDGGYDVQNPVAERGSAYMVVSSYSDYPTEEYPPAADSPLYGNFVALEGNLGPLAFNKNHAKWEDGGGGEDLHGAMQADKAHKKTLTTDDTGVYFKMEFLPKCDADWGTYDWHSKAKFTIPDLPEGARIMVNWPADARVSASSHALSGPNGKCAPYWVSLYSELSVQDDDDDTVQGLDHKTSICGTNGFNDCSENAFDVTDYTEYSGAAMQKTGTIEKGKVYKLRMGYHDEVEPKSHNEANCSKKVHADSGSYTDTTMYFPTIMIVK